MTPYLQLLTTTQTEADAQAIANAVVEKRLTACVQIIGPITSTYRWQGKIETAEEWLCLIKSREDLYERLEQAILQVHPYDVPEILAVPVVAGSELVHQTTVQGWIRRGYFPNAYKLGPGKNSPYVFPNPT